MKILFETYYHVKPFLSEKQKDVIKKIYLKFRYYPIIIKLKIIQLKPHSALFKKRKNIKTLFIINPKQIQETIDSLSYPPTHEYSIVPLKPRGVCKIRLEQFKSLSPKFFSGKAFLDIGCNKGFFSLYAAKFFDVVESFDVDKSFVDLYKLFKQSNMTVHHTSFRNYIPTQKFDKILLGNVSHYIFKECEGHDWIYKLAAISTGEVIIETGVDMNCKNMEKVIPYSLRDEYTFEKFMNIMSKFFTLKKIIPSLSSNRKIMLFERIPDSFNNKKQFKDLKISNIIKNDNNSTTCILDDGLIAKIYKRSIDEIKICIACMSPFTNGLVGVIYNGEKFVGWLETFGGKWYERFDNQKQVLITYCKHEIFLAKLGYIEADWSSCNVFETTNKIFDKGGMISIGDMHESIYEKHNQKPKGLFFIHYQQNFSLLNINELNLIYMALKSKDSVKIEKIFKTILDRLSNGII